MFSQNGGYYVPNYNPYMMQGGGAVPDMLNQMKMQYQPSVQIPKVPANEMLWVLNENEATSYPVAPNNSVVLWDKSNPTIYVKSVNAQGVPSMRILDFEERTGTPEKRAEPHKCTCGDKFVTKAEFDALKGKFYDLLAKYDAVLLEQKDTEKMPAKGAKITKKEAE